MINTDNMRLPHGMRPRLTEVPDLPFFSKGKGGMTEDSRADVRVKYGYLANHLKNMHEYLSAHKVNSSVEAAEHGRVTARKNVHRTLTSVKYAGLVEEIKRIQFECDRLQSILNA